MNLNTNKNIYKNLLNILNSGKKAIMITTANCRNQKNDYKRNEILLTEEDLAANVKSLDENLYKKALEVLETGKLQFINDENNGTSIIEPYFPDPKLIVLGGGHISKPLVEFASKVGFSVTVIDDRPSFANSARFPEAERVICESFDKCFENLNLNKSSFVVIVTRGHRHDMLCLKETLKYDTGYVGMIGSKRRIKITREQLLSEGYSKEILDNVNAPIGLDINAVSPEEVAISILAQLISYKRSKKVNYLEVDSSIIDELAKDNSESRAMATIVATKGSVPRRAGAKMIVYPDGRILGSIGGGCSEGEVINTARDIIRNGGYKIQKVDMTGNIAEDEGMVCGGIMEVFVEKLD